MFIFFQFLFPPDMIREMTITIWAVSLLSAFSPLKPLVNPTVEPVFHSHLTHPCCTPDRSELFRFAFSRHFFPVIARSNFDLIHCYRRRRMRMTALLFLDKKIIGLKSSFLCHPLFIFLFKVVRRAVPRDAKQMLGKW